LKCKSCFQVLTTLLETFEFDVVADAWQECAADRHVEDLAAGFRDFGREFLKLRVLGGCERLRILSVYITRDLFEVSTYLQAEIIIIIVIASSPGF
jgi:hypothetical protein